MFLKFKYVFLVMIILTVIFTGCGSSKGENNTAGTVDSPSQTSDVVSINIPDAISNTISKEEDEEPELTLGDNGSMEIYSGRDIISLSDDMIVGQVTVEDILQGNPILYDRFKTDGFVFEWIVSDYEDENDFLEDGVLLISKEDDAGNTQVIHVQAEGAYDFPVPLEKKFEYMDVSFDNVPDLLICTGHHGNQGLITYYCFLQTDDGFAEAPTFTEIPNPSVDTENKLILSTWRNSGASHSWAEYKYEDNAYVLYRELCEELARYEKGQDAYKDIWVWTVNGEEIGRSDKLSEAEIDDLLYNENSEWGIAGDRWTNDYSIYKP